MDTGDTDWSNLSLGDREDSLNAFQKQDESSIGSVDNRSDQVYDAQGEDDFASSLGIYDGYDSYNESVVSSDNDDLDTSLLEDEFLDTDESVSKYRFLNSKDGMATCERCGAVGVKHAFYSKSKRFCSLSCSRSYATYQREGKPVPPKPTPPAAVKKGKPGSKKINPKTQPSLFKASLRGETGRVFDWGPYLVSSQANAAPVSCFKHVPMNDCWDQMVDGVLVEVPNTDLDVPKDVKVYWIATVLKICGYKVLLRYEGFGSDGSKDFWSNLLSEDMHNVGWCATYGKMLSPPKAIKDKYVDWKEFLIKRLTGTRTIPPHFYAKSQEWLHEHKMKMGMQLEVVNKMCVSAMRLAVIKDIIGGRLRLNYADSGDEIDEFWCHMTSPLIHPIGWSQIIGHKLHASHDYINSCLSKVTMQKYGATDVTPDMFPKVKDPPHGLAFQVGMKLEAIDPLNLSAICVATVTKVLRNNYLMIGIDGSMAENGSDWFCYHATSPCIFPVGFCEINNLNLTPPRGIKTPFKWFDYLKQTRSMAAPVKLFDKEIPKHGFRVGMKVEAVDLMEPRLICVATVTKVVGRLLRIHFDGWENNYDQWIDCQSPDIYPVGWCEVMRHGLEGPRTRLEGAPAGNGPVNSKKRKGKTQIYRGPRKKRTSGSDKKARETTKSAFTTIDSGLRNQLVTSAGAPTLNRDPNFPPHKMLSPEAVAATLPPLLEPDIEDKSVSVKTEMASPTPGTDANPPILSPHGKMPQRFSQELAERLRANTPLKSSLSVSAINGNSSLSEKAAKPGATPQSSLSFKSSADKDSMESMSNLVASSSSVLGDSDLTEETGGGVIVLTLSSRLRALHLTKWSLSDVVDVLKVNGCGIYTNMFIKKNIDGSCLINMTTDQLTRLVSVVDGPILRLCDLVQQVKACAGASNREASNQ
ncbi:MBT domain-containing protein 1 [Aplysia californica]|uniref:MBT domain-containing protein 1 n=1 Tax=Aplysia californica TaxID=6500 RepID=A0ABM0JGV9_APLCA|nr:MBT domain-containing protein 1 [Aplysia californica]